MPRIEVNFNTVVACVVLLLTLSGNLLAQGLPTAEPEEVGMSSERLKRVTATMQRYVDRHEIAGAVTLVARRGKVVHFEAIGHRDVETNAPMTTDSIFRIASMTKPVTSIAAMMLWEEGHFQLNDPISRWLPEFAAMQVSAGGNEGDSARLVPARPITVRQLLTHTSGIATDVDRTGRRERPLADWVQKLSDLPLNFQPGEAWEYGHATHVVGRLVEVISGQSLDEFFRERIFEPLGMDDTGYFVPPDKLNRRAAVYGPDDQGKIRRSNSPFGSASEPPVFFSGTGGLVSTAADYVRLQQMMLNGGELDGVRLLGRKTVELMTANHVGGLFRRTGEGFGLGYAVTTDVADTGEPGSVGLFYWYGRFNTAFFVDPEEELIGIVMTQLSPNGHLRTRQTFRVSVYQAIIDAP